MFKLLATCLGWMLGDCLFSLHTKDYSHFNLDSMDLVLIVFIAMLVEFSLGRSETSN